MGLGEALPLLRGERGVDQGQAIVLFVGQVRGELGREFVGDVAKPLVAVVRVGGGGIDGGQQRLDDGVLGLQRVGQGQAVGMPGHLGAQRRPQHVVFGLVVDQEELLEQLPTQRGSQQRAGIVVAQRRDPCDLHEFPAQRVVHREHHAHIELVLHDSSSGVSQILTLSII